MAFGCTLKQVGLLVSASLLVSLCICQVCGVASMRKFQFYRDPAMPQLADLAAAFVLAAVFVSVRCSSLQVLRPVAFLALPPSKRNSSFRVDRFATSLFNLAYFSGITVAGFWLFAGEPWFPKALGGSGDVRESLAMFNKPLPAALKYYMLVELAFQLHSFIYVLLLKPFDRDTIEFIAHDLMAMMLIASSYLTNYVATGAIVTCINDACDVAEYAFLLATDSGRKALIVPAFALLVGSWGSLRLYVFPRECLYNYIVLVPQVNPQVSKLFLDPLNAMLTLLMVLHVYWLALFIRKGTQALRQAPTPQSKTIEAT